MRAVVFDTETTGLFDWKAAWDDPKQPHLVELAWQRIDLDSRTVLAAFEYFCCIPPDVVIEPKAIETHGITHKTLTEHGFPLEGVLARFVADCIASDVIASHNLEFDAAVIAASMKRANLPSTPELKAKKRFCTMTSTTAIAKLPKPNGGHGFKFPKLGEAYRALFNRDPPGSGAHTAAGDCQIAGEILIELHRLGLVDRPR